MEPPRPAVLLHYGIVGQQFTNRYPQSTTAHPRRIGIASPRGCRILRAVRNRAKKTRRTMNDKTAIRGLYIGWAVGLVMLALAVSGKHPYGFYTLLRWIACAVFASSALVVHRLERPAWTWVFAIEAMLFNPFIPVHFDRGTWQIADWLALISILSAAVVFSKHLRTSPPPP